MWIHTTCSWHVQKSSPKWESFRTSHALYLLQDDYRYALYTSVHSIRRCFMIFPAGNEPLPGLRTAFKVGWGWWRGIPWYPIVSRGGLDWCEHLCKNVQKKCLNMHWYDTYSLTHTHIYIIYTYIYWTIILWRFWGLIGIEFFRDLARRWYSHRGFGVAEAGAVASARFVRPPLRSIAYLVHITRITMVYGTYNILWL